MGVIWETDFIYAITRRDSKYAQIKIIKSSGMIPKVELTAFARHWLDLQGYDVTRREPELLPCPFCGGKCIIKNRLKYNNDIFYNVICMSDAEGCGYESKWINEKSEAIRVHNLIAERGEK